MNVGNFRVYFDDTGANRICSILSLISLESKKIVFESNNIIIDSDDKTLENIMDYLSFELSQYPAQKWHGLWQKGA